VLPVKSAMNKPRT